MKPNVFVMGFKSSAFTTFAQKGISVPPRRTRIRFWDWLTNASLFPSKASLMPQGIRRVSPLEYTYLHLALTHPYHVPRYSQKSSARTWNHVAFCKEIRHESPWMTPSSTLDMEIERLSLVLNKILHVPPLSTTPPRRHSQSGLLWLPYSNAFSVAWL